MEEPSLEPHASPSIQLNGGEVRGKQGASSSVEFAVDSWLRTACPDPWPDPLIEALDGKLDPVQVRLFADNSPWSAEGAWAIYQAIRVKGERLANQAGTLWNALANVNKGQVWLAKAGPHLRAAGWQARPGDGMAGEDPSRAKGAKRLRELKYARLPLWGPALNEEMAMLRLKNLGPLCIDDDEGIPDPPQASPRPEPVTRTVEDFAPEVKAALKREIDGFTEARMQARQVPEVNRPGFFEAAAQSFERIRQLLEPELPIRIFLPCEGRDVDIRAKEEIKWSAVNAIYRAVS